MTSKENLFLLPPKHLSVRYLLDLCSEKYKDKGISKVKIKTGDTGNDSDKLMYVCCYNQYTQPDQLNFCGPDGSFYKWNVLPNSFEDLTYEISKRSLETPCKNKVGWYGNIHTTKLAWGGHNRKILKEIGDKNKDKFEIVQSTVNSKNSKTLPDLVSHYRYLIDIGGNGYSTRLKYLLFSRRPLLLVDRAHVEYFNCELKPYVHYIPVKMDLSDLIEKTLWMFDNNEKCKEVSENAFEFASKNFSLDLILERIYQVYKNLEKEKRKST